MNLITNYYDLNLSQWEGLAHTACYEHKQEVKSAAERIFYDLTEAPDLSLIMSLVNSGSETLVFVVFSYLAKYPSKFGKSMENVTGLISRITSWQFTAFTFIRDNSPPFQKYVTRTIMTSLGVFLKILYEDLTTSAELSQYLANLKSNFFKLYLLKSFIDAVEVVDYEMGYVKYRAMVYSFQDNVIPNICDTLMPYFYNIEEGVQISELSFLQGRIDINDSSLSQANQHISITSDQELETDYVFMLLEKIVDFNYNITYSEYENDLPIDTCLITFPDKISQKIHTNQFLDALFFIIQKVSSVKRGERRHQYLQTSLKCVAKLVQSRLTYVNFQIKDSYFFHALKGLTHLLIKCQQIGSQTLLQGIIICNKKLYMNCEFTYLKNICFKQCNNIDLYNAYIRDLLSMISIIIQRSPVHVENHLLLQTLEVTSKLLQIFGFRDQETMDEETAYFRNFAKSIINSFMNNLATPAAIFQETKIISILQSKPLVTQLFEYFKKIGSVYYQFFFLKILQIIDQFIRNGQKSLISFANIIFLLSEIIDRNYLQRNLYLNSAKDKQYCILGAVIKKVTDLIAQYISVRKDFAGQEAFYIDAAIVIFMEAITLEFLINFECTTHFKIKQRLYLFMTYGQFYNEFSNIEDEKSEETIVKYLRVLTDYLSFAGGSDQHEVLVHYALGSIEKSIFKVKWHMKRQIYLKTHILRFLTEYFQGFFYEWNYKRSVRSRVAKILVTLTFDDVLDEYKFRINKFLSIICEQPFPLMQYDLMGLFEGIETHSISKYFYRRLKRELDLNLVIASLFQTAKMANEEKLYGDFCKLARTILNNKGFRISNGVIAYQVFSLILPYLNALLKMITQGNCINMELWESSICEMIEIFKGVLGGTHINIFMLDEFASQRSNNSLIKDFSIELIKTIILLSCNIQVFPDMEQTMLSICFEINRSLLQYIISDSSGQLVQVYALLHVKIIDITVNFIKMTINGNKGLEDKLIKAFDCLRSFYAFFNKKCKIIHQQLHIANLRRIYEISQNFMANNGTENKNLELIEFLINFILASQKNNLHYMKTITRLLFELNQKFNGHIMLTLSRLSLRQDKLAEIQRILNNHEKVDEQSFTEKIKAWIRERLVFN